MTRPLDDPPRVKSTGADAPERYVLVITPAGFERYFARMGTDDPPEWAPQPFPETTRVGPQIALPG